MLDFKTLEQSVNKIIESDYYKKLKIEYMKQFVIDLDIEHIDEYYLIVPESKISELAELGFNEYIKPKWFIFDKYAKEYAIIKVPQKSPQKKD